MDHSLLPSAPVSGAVTGVSCGFSPRAWFPSHVIQAGGSCNKTAKMCTELSPVSPVWSAPCLGKHLLSPWGLCGRCNLLPAARLQKRWAAGSVGGQCLHPLLSTAARAQNQRGSGKEQPVCHHLHLRLNSKGACYGMCKSQQ